MKRSLIDFVPAVIGAAIVTVAVTVVSLRRSSLPPTIATHWDSSGKVDGFASSGSTIASTIGSAALAVACFAALTILRRRRTASGSRLIAVAIAALVTSMYASATIDSLLHAQGDGAATPGPGVLRLAAVVFVPILLVVAGVRAVAMPQPVDEAWRGPRLNLAHGERAVWIGSLTSLPMLVGPLFVIAAGLVFPLQFRLWPFLGLVPLGIVLCGLAHIRVRVDASGLRVFYGFGSLISTHIDARKIVQAEAIDVKPSAWGGWGYRGSLRLFKRAAVVLRRGPGIRLQLTGGQQFAVTVDHPDDAVALLNAYATP
jgi:Protein of unknown function (DUF1648)